MKKTASRILALTLALVLVAALLNGCGGSTEPEGVYRIKRLSYGSMMMNFDDPKSMADMVGVSTDEMEARIDQARQQIYLELKPNGTFRMGGLGQQMEGTYTIHGKTVTLTVDGESMDATLDGDTFTITIPASSVGLSEGNDAIGVFVKEKE